MSERLDFGSCGSENGRLEAAGLGGGGGGQLTLLGLNVNNRVCVTRNDHAEKGGAVMTAKGSRIALVAVGTDGLGTG
jgi:hypothetical protein